jgi:hypothetical protein
LVNEFILKSKKTAILFRYTEHLEFPLWSVQTTPGY